MQVHVSTDVGQKEGRRQSNKNWSPLRKNTYTDDAGVLPNLPSLDLEDKYKEYCNGRAPLSIRLPHKVEMSNSQHVIRKNGYFYSCRPSYNFWILFQFPLLIASHRPSLVCHLSPPSSYLHGHYLCLLKREKNGNGFEYHRFVLVLEGRRLSEADWQPEGLEWVDQ